MRKLLSIRFMLVVAGAAGVFVGGVAFGASSPGSPGSSFFDSVAQHLGISSEKLADATKAAQIDQVNAALAAGRISKDQADALKTRINASDPAKSGFGFGLPFRFGIRPGGGTTKPNPIGPVFGRGHGAGLDLRQYITAAADYLKLSEEVLGQKLRQGQSLADVAKAQNKSADGLEQVLYDKVKARLDQAVKDKRLTSDQETKILATTKTVIDKIVNAKFKVPDFGAKPARPRAAHRAPVF